jgi:hypothetical protein
MTNTNTNSKNKSKFRKSRFITLPVMVHRDDHNWVEEQLSYVHERYRQNVAYLYSGIFFRALHEPGISDIGRSNHARKTANAWLLTLVNEIINGSSC